MASSEDGSSECDAPRQVRAAAGAVGCWLGDAEVLQELSGRPELAQQALAWAEAVSSATLDPAHAVSASGFAAIRCACSRDSMPCFMSWTGQRCRAHQE